jgi:putative spermidine/putrescine transport system ATP-binding protein
MASVHLEGIRKVFGSFVALESLELQIASGEMVCLLGPSGCGKTTALRILAGFEQPDGGRVLVEDQDITGMSPQKRGFGMVFQDYSLFPNMTARDNVGFGLAVRKVPAAKRAEAVDRLIEVTRLSEHADKYPHQMSGGQKQRVALARALATEPRVLLLDEPLSALDAKVRESLRVEIRRIQQETGVTTLFVTHDQHEAMAVADRVGVMQEGRLVQIDPPQVLYSRPATPFVATFVGTVNTVPATQGLDGRWTVLGAPTEVVGMVGATPSGQATVVVRPEQLVLVGAGAGASGTVRSVSFLGATTRVGIDVEGAGEVLADLMVGEVGRIVVGDRVSVAVRSDGGAVVATTDA